MSAIHLLRQVSLRANVRPSFVASSCRAFSSSATPETPQSAMDGSDKSLNRLSRTESMVSRFMPTISTPGLLLSA